MPPAEGKGFCRGLHLLNVGYMENIRIVPIQQFCVLCDHELQARDTTLGLAAQLCRASQVQGVVAVWGDFSLRRGASLCRHVAIRYDATTRKTCRRGVSWRW